MAIIDKPTDYFNTLLYAGNDGTGRSITGVGFQPDFVWIKDRSNAYKHGIFDVKRGVTKVVSSNSDSVEETISNSLTAFGTDGFTVGSNALVNGNNNNYVSWNWKAGSAISNNAGSPVGTSLASSGSVNTDAGFSVVTYASNGNNYTVPHGLGVAPNVVIVKNRSISKYWAVYHSSLGNTKAVYLDSSAAPDTDNTYWQNTTPTSTVFSVGTNSGNNSGNAMVAYSFAQKQGYSKFGNYTGNGNANGTFVYTGFKPAFVMLKNATDASDWNMKDSKRPGFNQVNDILYPNLNNAEEHGGDIDILSNGFKTRTTAANTNDNASTYIYFAFAENPFVTSTDNNSIPATAR
tara:strand:+ start:16 stop:1059 length:1044 start_codon:yes stop_codon:yes gene_type:complete